MLTTKDPVPVRALKNDWRTRGRTNYPSYLTEKEGQIVKKFYQSFRNYKPTPLVNLKKLAGRLGLAAICVKDESFRFGLNAFKALGATYAIARIICERTGTAQLEFAHLQASEVREKAGTITFATATDGNHGRGVAWAARQFGQKAVVYLPKGSARQRVEAIRQMGAHVFVTDVNYDDTVLLMKEQAHKNGWQLVQDTAWKGYEEVPRMIMQGYLLMVAEALDQMKEAGHAQPTHVFIQAGVGSMPAAVLGYLVNTFGRESCPITACLEPDNAACIFNSFLAGDGKPHRVVGNLETIMAGLACGMPSTLAWEVLRDFTDVYVSCSDEVAARGMRILGNPLKGDKRIISGESGAVGIGLLSLLMEYPSLQKIREELKLDKDSVVLLFSTEGDTDPENYRKIVWDGNMP